MEEEKNKDQSYSFLFTMLMRHSLEIFAVFVRDGCAEKMYSFRVISEFRFFVIVTLLHVLMRRMCPKGVWSTLINALRYCSGVWVGRRDRLTCIMFLCFRGFTLWANKARILSYHQLVDISPQPDLRSASVSLLLTVAISQCSLFSRCYSFIPLVFWTSGGLLKYHLSHTRQV